MAPTASVAAVFIGTPIVTDIADPIEAAAAYFPYAAMKALSMSLFILNRSFLTLSFLAPYLFVP